MGAFQCEFLFIPGPQRHRCVCECTGPNYRAWSFHLGVCLFANPGFVCPAKTTERIEMPFGVGGRLAWNQRATISVSLCPKRLCIPLLDFKALYKYTHTRLTALCSGLPWWAGTRKEKPIWILLKRETVSGSGISWAICKSAPHTRQITTPAPLHSVFYRPDALPAPQPTASKH